MIRRLATISIIALAVVIGASSAFAQGGGERTDAQRSPGEVSNVVEELSQEIYSPYCPGKTLAMCPSGGASKVRQDIQALARDGMAKEEIKQTILEEHGEEFRLHEPPTEDNYPLIAIIIVGLIVCITAVVIFARSRDSEEAGAVIADADFSEEDEIYLEEIRSRYEE